MKKKKTIGIWCWLRDVNQPLLGKQLFDIAQEFIKKINKIALLLQVKENWKGHIIFYNKENAKKTVIKLDEMPEILNIQGQDCDIACMTAMSISDSKNFKINISTTDIDVILYSPKFLPHNIENSNQQYDIWKKNAPTLAHFLRDLDNDCSSKGYELITYLQTEFSKYAFYSPENIFYLTNSPATLLATDPITGEIRDEEYIPFELLNREDWDWKEYQAVLFDD